MLVPARPTSQHRVTCQVAVNAPLQGRNAALALYYDKVRAHLSRADRIAFPHGVQVARETWAERRAGGQLLDLEVAAASLDPVLLRLAENAFDKAQAWVCAGHGFPRPARTSRGTKGRGALAGSRVRNAAGDSAGSGPGTRPCFDLFVDSYCSSRRRERRRRPPRYSFLFPSHAIAPVPRTGHHGRSADAKQQSWGQGGHSGGRKPHWGQGSQSNSRNNWRGSGGGKRRWESEGHKGTQAQPGNPVPARGGQVRTPDKKQHK